MPKPTAHDTEVLQKFEKLLDEGRKEEVYQKFLEENPRLIPQEFVQNHGVHFSLVFRKLRLAENYTTDFFFLAKSSADWNAVFIEIEKPTSRYFKDGTDKFSPDLYAGLDQMNRWRAWVRTPGNLEHFVSETLEPIWQPPGMRDNPIYPKFVLVTGRRSELSDDTRKRKLVQSQERDDDFKIISYDSLISGYRSNQDVYLAIRSNSHVEIQSHRFVDEALFAYIDPARLSISQELYNDAVANRKNWQYYLDLKTLRLDNRLPKVKVRSTKSAPSQRRR